MSEASKAKKKRKPWKQVSEEVKQQALERMDQGESVGALAQQIGVHRTLLYVWRQLRELSREGSSQTGEPENEIPQPRSLHRKIEQLEAVIGRKCLELDFFAAALRRVNQPSRTDGSGGKRSSTTRSGSGRRKAN